MRALFVSFVVSGAPGAAPVRAGEVGEVHRVLDVDGARIEVILPERRLDVGEDAIVEWITSAARSVTAYVGRFPVSRASVRIRTHGGRGVGAGTARSDGGPRIQVSLGEETTREDLRRDSLMTHEMIHVAFPSVRGPHGWMEEGLATYLEAVTRARVGAITPDEAWTVLVTLLPKGLPREGDGGLSENATPRRTYWGGAIFWLRADVEIRRRTHGRRGLDDVVRAIVAAGGNIGETWDVERIIEVGDRAARVPVLRPLYARMTTGPERVDLGKLWRTLGVPHGDGRATLDDTAPLASVRRGIMATAR